MTKEQNLKLLIRDSYLKLIQNSIGAKVWRNFYAEVDGKKKDVLKNGELSCAFFVSFVLLIFGLIKRVHFTVKGTIEDMGKSGWYEIKKLKPGAVLLWEKQKQAAGREHYHLGFILNDKQAISNRWEKKSPIVHHLTYGIKKDGSPARKIEKIFWHKKLEQ